MSGGKRYAYHSAGASGSYTTIFFDVQQQQLAEFIKQLEHSQINADADLFYSLYGIRAPILR